MSRGILMLACVSLAACAPSEPSRETAELGPFLDSLMVEHGVPGLGFALFDDAGLVFEHVSGLKNADGREEIGRETVFEAASISKPVFAYVVLSLAGDGILDVDAPLHTLVSQIPELSYDARASDLTPRLLLTHQGGLPNWRSRLNFDATSYAELFAAEDTLRFVTDPGAGHRYSGEGYVLLQRVIEQHTGQSLGELAEERVFGPLAMTRTSFLFNDRNRGDAAMGHNAEGMPDKWEIRVPLSSSTLHTTAADLGRFGAHLVSVMRAPSPFEALGSPAVTIERDGEIERSWGAGLGVVTDGSRRFLYHGGNNVIFIADLLYGFEENLGYALLTNSANGARMVDAVEQRVFGRAVGR